MLPHLTLMTKAAQREHSLRELFNALRYVIRYGIAWRAMPNDLPPWAAVHQQARRWMAAGCFEALGGGAVLCLGHALPQAGQRPRTLCCHRGRLSRHRLRRIHAQARGKTYAKCITPSRED